MSVNEIVSELPQYEVPQPLFDYEKISSLKQILSVTGKVFRFIRKVKGWLGFIQGTLDLLDTLLSGSSLLARSRFS